MFYYIMLDIYYTKAHFVHCYSRLPKLFYPSDRLIYIKWLGYFHHIVPAMPNKKTGICKY